MSLLEFSDEEKTRLPKDSLISQTSVPERTLTVRNTETGFVAKFAPAIQRPAPGVDKLYGSPSHPGVQGGFRRIVLYAQLLTVRPTTKDSVAHAVEDKMAWDGRGECYCVSLQLLRMKQKKASGRE